MTLLITGGSGYLAHRLIPLACQRGLDTVAVSRHRPDWLPPDARWRSVDLLDDGAIDAVVVDVAPTAVISAAAVNAGQSGDFGVNERGAASVAHAAAAIGARLVHVSSDVVHDGRLDGRLDGRRDGGPGYADDVEPRPINDYGRSKAAGERAVLDADPGAAVVRTSLIYGVEVIDRGTAGFIERLERGERLGLWRDAIRQPVWIDALANGLLDLALVHRSLSGTINLAGGESMSRAEFARRLLRHWGVDADDRIDWIGAAPGHPLDLRLDLTRARSIGLPTPGVAEVLSARPR